MKQQKLAIDAGNGWLTREGAMAKGTLYLEDRKVHMTAQPDVTTGGWNVLVKTFDTWNVLGCFTLPAITKKRPARTKLTLARIGTFDAHVALEATRAGIPCLRIRIPALLPAERYSF